VNKAFSTICLAMLASIFTANTYGMGLRSFVALPVEKDGGVVRLSFIHADDADTDTFVASAAYGISAKQTLLLGMPYRLSPGGDNRQGDLSVLYRHLVVQKDNLHGTYRLGLLGGAIVPTDSDRDAAIQAGFVTTYFQNRHEVDTDIIFQAGTGDRADSGRYDISWQYRLTPAERPEWGINQEWNSVLELNGRWTEGNNMTHQITAGLQWLHPKWVIEGGLVQDLNNEEEFRYLLSMRFHF